MWKTKAEITLCVHAVGSNLLIFQQFVLQKSQMLELIWAIAVHTDIERRFNPFCTTDIYK